MLFMLVSVDWDWDDDDDDDDDGCIRRKWKKTVYDYRRTNIH